MADSPDSPARQGGIPKHMSPNSQGGKEFLLPSPIITKRTRTKSMTERAAEGPSFTGVVKSFCRQKGHGFIHPTGDKTEDIFVHISDVDGEWVPREGDEVSYKQVHIPPKYEKLQAVHVVITHLKPGVCHERWDSSEPVSPDKIPTE